MLEVRLPRKLLLAAGACLFLYLAPGAGAYSGSISIHATKRDILYGRSTVLTGRVSDEQGQPIPFVPVALRSALYPYHQQWTTGVTTFTNAQGLYAIEVTPDYNSRYFVRRVSTVHPAQPTKPRSRTILVAVYPFPRFSLQTTGGYVRAHYQLKFSPALPTPIADRRVTWYMHDGSGSRWRTVAHDRTREIRPGVIRTGLRHKPSSPGQSSRVNACIDFPKKHDLGFGRPRAHPTSCPRRGYRA